MKAGQWLKRVQTRPRTRCARFAHGGDGRLTSAQEQAPDLSGVFKAGDALVRIITRTADEVPASPRERRSAPRRAERSAEAAAGALPVLNPSGP